MCGFGSRSALSHSRAKRDGRLELQGGMLEPQRSAGRQTDNSVGLSPAPTPRAAHGWAVTHGNGDGQPTAVVSQ